MHTFAYFMYIVFFFTLNPFSPSILIVISLAGKTGKADQTQGTKPGRSDKAITHVHILYILLSKCSTCYLDYFAVS